MEQNRFPSWARPELMIHNFADISSFGLPTEEVAILTEGIPRRFLGRFLAKPSLEWLAAGESTLVSFGYVTGFSMDGFPVCLDPRTWRIVEVLAAEEPLLVNTSLRLFCTIMHGFLDRFPFHAREADEEERFAAAEMLADTIRAIDPPAMGSHQFWPVFIDDVAMGNFDLALLEEFEPMSRVLRNG